MTRSFVQLSSLALILCILLSKQVAVAGPGVYGNFVEDLIGGDITQFTNEVQQWQVSGLLSGTAIYTYNTVLQLGGPGYLGYNAYFERTYTDLPTHDIIYFVMKLIVFGPWASNDFIVIAIDGTTIATWSFTQGYSSGVIGLVRPKGKFVHSASSVTLRITSQINSSPSYAYFLLRAVSLHFRTQIAGDATSICATSDVSAVYNSLTYGCSCETGYYLSGGVCKHCNTACRECGGAGTNQCFGCAVGYDFDGTNCVQCDPSCSDCTGSAADDCVICASSSYQYWDGTCRSSCSSPNTAIAGTYSRQCIPICQQNNQFTLWDQTCSSTCDPPLIQRTQGGVKFCDFPCSTANYRYYPDGSCKPSCVLPYIEQPLYSRYICKFKCSDPTPYYYPTTSSCDTTCITPLTPDIQPYGKYCNYNCPTSASILYYDGSCKSSCPTDWKSYSVVGVTVCMNACSDTSKFFYTSDQTCGTTCDPPFHQRIVGTDKYCDFPCSGPNNHAYPDASCQPSCALPYVESTSHGQYLCKFKCAGSTPYYYPSSTACQATCDSPFTEGIQSIGKFCKSNCPTNAPILYYDKSCKTICPTDWMTYTIEAVQVCINSCRDTTKFFSIADGTCIPTCPLPFITVQPTSSNKRCDIPCATGLIYHKINGGCERTCDAPFHLVPNEYGYNICHPPCPDSSYYYYAWNKTCMPSCEYPYTPEIQHAAKFCNIDLNDDEMKQLESLNSLAEGTQTAATTVGIISALLSYSDPGAMNAASLVKMLQYMKLLQIKYPTRLYLILQQQKIMPVGLTFSPKASKGIKANFEMQPLPSIFVGSNLHSNFLVNCWEFSISVLIIVTLIVIIFVLKYLAKNVAKMKSVLQKAENALKWNFALTIFCSNFGDIAIYTVLDLNTLSFDSFLSGLSFVACLIFNGTALFVLIKTAQITLDYSRQVTEKDNKISRAVKIKQFQKKWECYEVLFSGYYHSSLFRHMFIIIFALRAYILNLIIGLLYEYPVIQTVLLTTMSAFMVAYLSFKLPMTKGINNIQQLFLEVIILLINICLLSLSTMDTMEGDVEHRRKVVAEIIIILNLLTSTSCSVFLGLKVVLIVREIYLERKAGKSDQVKSKTRRKLELGEKSKKDIQLEVPRFPDPARTLGPLRRPNRLNSRPNQMLIRENILMGSLQPNIGQSATGNIFRRRREGSNL